MSESGQPVWSDIWSLATTRLRAIAEEIRHQPVASATFTESVLSLDEHMKQVDEFIDANELGLAYETIVCMLEDHPFVVSGATAVQLLEVGLLFRFKSESQKDKAFDIRQA